MPRRVSSRESTAPRAENGQSTTETDRELRLGSQSRSHDAGHHAGHRAGHGPSHGAGPAMPPQEPLDRPELRRRRRSDDSPSWSTECQLDSGTGSLPGLQSVLTPGSEPEPISSPEPESEPEPERRHSSPERAVRSASPESASRLARRAKRQRRLHDESTPTAADGPHHRPVRSARRCLFGRPDHAELDRALREEQEELRRAETLRWNFDFHREQPLEGRWRWERVGRRGRAPDRTP
ncbi:translation initiation factor IF-2-like [Amphibalanus amphitrite]|uniref:translation initiation factor IF-2-like n=1 Tax=Amphibalanus amphitrite TaxID=1232801 RepID=UPI001C907B50|nr:translation initiation factor IF-2-like [Amphibalanus amphitrite]